MRIPDRFVKNLEPAGRDVSRAPLKESAAGAYRDRRLTMEQVRELVGFGTRMQVNAFLQQHAIFDFSVDDLERNLVTLDRVVVAKDR